jgi:hypothetical protein
MDWLAEALAAAAAIGEPPAENHDRESRGHGPPEGQRKIGKKTQCGERDPEDLAFHIVILQRQWLP